MANGLPFRMYRLLLSTRVYEVPFVTDRIKIF